MNIILLYLCTAFFFLIYSSVGDLLGCFDILAMVQWMLIYKYLLEFLFTILWRYRMKLLAHMIIPWFLSSGTTELVFSSDTILHSYQQCTDVPFLHILVHTCIFPSFLFHFLTLSFLPSHPPSFLPFFLPLFFFFFSYSQPDGCEVVTISTWFHFLSLWFVLFFFIFSSF